MGYPKAALLAFGLAWLAYTAVALSKAALRSAHGRPKVHDEVASYDLSLEMRRTDEGMMIALPAPPWGLFRAVDQGVCQHGAGIGGIGVPIEIAATASWSQEATAGAHRVSER